MALTYETHCTMRFRCQKERQLGYADDVAVIVVGKFLEEVTWIAHEAIRIIRQWISYVGLQLADYKTE